MEVTAQDNGLWTVHLNGVGQPGKIYDCEGRTPWEAVENAQAFIDSLKELIGGRHDCDNRL